MFRKCAGSLFQRVGAADVKDLSPSVSKSGARLMEQQATVGSKTVFRYIFNTYQITYVFREKKKGKKNVGKTLTVINHRY